MTEETKSKISYPSNEKQEKILNILTVAMNGEHDEYLYNADPNCDHEVEPQWSGGVKCKKCPGWFCF